MLISRIAKSALALAVMALSFTACKDDDNVDPDGGDSGGSEKVFIPAADKTYYYDITDSDGEDASMTTKVISTKDSAGLTVHTLRHTLKEEGAKDIPMLSKAYAKGGTTTNELPYPFALQTLIVDLREIAVIHELKLTGFPHYQYLENNGKVNSPLTFKGDPIKMTLKLEIPVGDEGSVDATAEATITYKNGKAVAEESVTTPAGEFKCVKWEYTYETRTKFETDVTAPEETSEVYKVTLWTAPGVGIVKTIEKSEENTSTTELRKIE